MKRDKITFLKLWMVYLIDGIDEKLPIESF